MREGSRTATAAIMPDGHRQSMSQVTAVDELSGIHRVCTAMTGVTDSFNGSGYRPGRAPTSALLECDVPLEGISWHS
jgi:hypothetical protein